jgi:pilus assembly protein Flp/PilA
MDKRKRPSEDGATSVEYALMAALIALVVIGGVTALGVATNDLFGRPCSELASVGHPCS